MARKNCGGRSGQEGSCSRGAGFKGRFSHLPSESSAQTGILTGYFLRVRFSEIYGISRPDIRPSLIGANHETREIDERRRWHGGRSEAARFRRREKNKSAISHDQARLLWIIWLRLAFFRRLPSPCSGGPSAVCPGKSRGDARVAAARSPIARWSVKFSMFGSIVL